MEVKHYLLIVLRRWWIIVLGALVVGVVVFLVTFNARPVYSASAQLLIDKPPTDQTNQYNQLLLEQRLAQNYVEIIKLRSVLDETIDILNLPFDTEELSDKVFVSTLRDTPVIEIRVEDSDPARATTIANAIGQVFINQNQERESIHLGQLIAIEQNRLELINTERSSLEAILADDELDQSVRNQYEIQLAELSGRSSNAIENLSALLTEEVHQGNNVVLLEEAQPTNTPIRPRLFRSTLLATVVGGLLGLTTVFLLDYLDDTVKDPDQVKKETGLPILGNVAIIKDVNHKAKLVAHVEPRHPISEAYRTLRTNLQFAAVDGGLRSIMVTSPSQGEGKSTTLANLAVVLAQQGKKVIVVDADLRRPSQHEIFEIDQRRGLSTALVYHKLPVMHYVHQTRIPNLYVMPSGKLPPNPVDLLGSGRMKAIVEALLANGDVIVFDSPPILTVSDATILASYAKVSLMVALFGQTKQTDLFTAVKDLEAAHAHLYGIVINMLKVGRGYYFYRHYKQQQAYTYKDDEMGSVDRASIAIAGETSRQQSN